MNLMIVLAVIAIVVLAAQYISQLRKNRSGNNFVSGGRVFLNWVLAIVLVVCVVGIGVGSFHSHRQAAKPAESEKTENVKYVSSSDEALGDVSVQFDKKVKMDDNGEVKVKFKVSPQTKLTIRGHKTKGIVKVFKASKGTEMAKHSYTFDVAGTYDIIAQRGDQKVTKKLKVEANDNDNASDDSASSSSAASSSSSTASSSTTANSSSSVASSSSSASSSTRRSNVNASGNTRGSRNSSIRAREPQQQRQDNPPADSEPRPSRGPEINNSPTNDGYGYDN